jgi:hypothetical protein
MRAHVHARSEELARGLGPEDRAHVTPGRRLRVRAVAAATAAWHGIRHGLSGLAGRAERYLLAPMLGRSERRRALTELAAMDDRLLADIGLRRGDIELAVDGRLADPRIARRASGPVPTDWVLEAPRCPAPATAVNSNRAPAQPDRAPDLAA